MKNQHENKRGGGRLGGIDYFEVGNVWDGKIEGESDSRKVAEAATDAVADYIFDVVNLSSPALIKPCLVRVPGDAPPWEADSSVGYIACVPVEKALVGFMCAGWLAACSTGQPAHETDVATVFTVKSTFGPEFRVRTDGPSGIDPRMVGPQQLPPSTAFDPPDCAKYATGQSLPQGIQGKMAAVSADGKGNRFTAIAIQANEQVPFEAVPDQCKHVTFKAGNLSGVTDVVDAPRIDGVQTAGTYRRIQATIGKIARSDEFYHYVADFGHSAVIVTAIPVVIPNQPPPPVDVERARRLLTDAVSALRS